MGVNRHRRLVVAFVALLSVGVACAVPLLHQRAPEEATTKRAAIVDQLAGTDPNQTLIDDLRDRLQRSGYVVDYYSPASVTVDLYKRIFGGDYSLTILRSHSASHRSVDGFDLKAVSLFTNEPYRADLYLSEQRASRLYRAWYPGDASGQAYFSVRPQFIEYSAAGRFPQGSVVVLLGCAGLSSEGMARAFVDRGVNAFISWDQNVTVDQDDAAALPLISHLVSDGMNARDAVAAANREIHADSGASARLAAFP
ncbi:MAG: hypothetical protein M3P30_09485 [Chloroflexota bacterium]|nr:hypothetical protein [Chloroflexota bacterium]